MSLCPPTDQVAASVQQLLAASRPRPPAPAAAVAHGAHLTVAQPVRAAVAQGKVGFCSEFLRLLNIDNVLSIKNIDPLNR